MRDLLDKTFLQIIADANSAAKWYQDKKNGKSFWSKCIRLLSIVLIGLGGIFPLVGKIGLDDKHPLAVVSDWGYISIAAAGTLLFIDRFFGLSSAWVRYVTTELEIRRQLKDFVMKWTIDISKFDLCKEELNCDKMVQMLTLLKDFSNSIDELVKQETANWATEFQNNITELQKIANSKIDELKPGFIKVVVKNANICTSVVVKVDGVERKTLVGTEALIENITVGPHTVIAEGTLAANDNKAVATIVINVEANKVTSAELTLQ